MIGDVLLDCAWAGQTLAGFENHAGRTILDPGAEPLGRVVDGFGNDGESASRAAATGRRTARTCTARCCRATPGSPTASSRTRCAHAGGDPELAPLPDELEQQAHEVSAGRARARGGAHDAH